MNTHYRIKFYKVIGFKYFDTNIKEATHYQVFKNNSKIGECLKLIDAVELIIENEGQNRELDLLIDNLYYIQNNNLLFETVGLVYTTKHGVRIEQAIKGNV